jgi:hypothetical protein
MLRQVERSGVRRHRYRTPIELGRETLLLRGVEVEVRSFAPKDSRVDRV